ncbi:MAG: hypothetical protein GDA56_00195 [Hormoscilla sp. GM7CHS1pb]|nr:hypothetical protein [Hormoscilla sp. GM7CHS1pb]
MNICMNVNRLNRFLDGARPRWERSPLRLCVPVITRSQSLLVDVPCQSQGTRELATRNVKLHFMLCLSEVMLS